MPRSRLVGEDKGQCGKRALAVAAALRSAKPNFYARPTPGQLAAQTTWQCCVLQVMGVFSDTNESFPEQYFLSLCGLNTE